MQIVKINENIAIVNSGGLELKVALDLLEDVSEGDYVIVHAGYAIQSLSEDEALETLAILQRMVEE
jgi:hydrogenase expression/formation protein HypC